MNCYRISFVKILIFIHFQDQLTKELDKVCDILLNPRRISHCKSRIDTVMPLIINSANVVVNSQSICFALQLCLTPLMDVLENEKVNILYINYFNL